MPVYRVTFVRNEIATINEAIGRHYLGEDDYILEHQGGLIYAIIKADNEEEVRRKIEKMRQRSGAAQKGFIDI